MCMYIYLYICIYIKMRTKAGQSLDLPGVCCTCKPLTLSSVFYGEVVVWRRLTNVAYAPAHCLQTSQRFPKPGVGAARAQKQVWRDPIQCEAKGSTAV